MRLQHRLSLPMIPRTVSANTARVRRSPVKLSKLPRYSPNRSRSAAVNSIAPSLPPSSPSLTPLL